MSEFITNNWEALAGTIGGLIVFLLFGYKRLKAELKQLFSTVKIDSANGDQRLLELINELKVKIVDLHSSNVSLYDDRAKRDRIINLIETECPDCYQRVMNIIADELEKSLSNGS